MISLYLIIVKTTVNSKYVSFEIGLSQFPVVWVKGGPFSKWEQHSCLYAPWANENMDANWAFSLYVSTLIYRRLKRSEEHTTSTREHLELIADRRSAITVWTPTSSVTDNTTDWQYSNSCTHTRGCVRTVNSNNCDAQFIHTIFGRTQEKLTTS